MADENDHNQSAAQRHDSEALEPQTDSADVESGADESTTLEPAAEQAPGDNLQEFTTEQLNEMARRIDEGLPLTDEPEKATEEAEESEDATPAVAQSPKGKRVRTTLDHLSDKDQAAQLEILTLTRKGVALADAVAQVLKPVAKSTETAAPERQAEQQPTDAMQVANVALKEAKAGLREARDSYDSDAIEAAEADVEKASRAVIKLELRAEMEERDAEIAGRREEKAARAEISKLTSAIPELTDPDSPLTAVYDRMVERADDEDLGPGSAEKFARAAWDKVYPGKAFPINGSAARPSLKLVPPPKNGRPVAALATNGGARRDVNHILQNPDQYSMEELRAAAAGM